MFLLPFLLGFIFSYIGSISPSMLTITAVKISIEKNKTAAKRFSLGIAVVVIFQSFIALYFLKIILNNDDILELIQKTAIIVFALLSFYFFREEFKEKQEIVASKTTKNEFLSGVFLSLINLFSIPFYVGIAAFLNQSNWLFLDITSVCLFSLGSFIGTYVILYHYILFADKMKSKIEKFSRYFNYILGGITGIVAIISLLKML